MHWLLPTAVLGEVLLCCTSSSMAPVSQYNALHWGRCAGVGEGERSVECQARQRGGLWRGFALGQWAHAPRRGVGDAVGEVL